MSYTEIYKVPEKGEIESYADVNNAGRGAYLIWSGVYKHYIGNKFNLWKDDHCKSVSYLVKDNDVHINDRIVIATTLENMMIRRENLPLLINAMEDFGNRHDNGNLPEQVEHLKALVQDSTCFAVCWNQTNGDAWEVNSGEIDEDGEKVWRMYDVSKDNVHLFLFEEYPKLLEAANVSLEFRREL